MRCRWIEYRLNPYFHMSFSATDCPLDDTCMDIHMSEKTPTSLGHQLRGMEREANAKVVSLAMVVMVEVVVM